MMACSMSLEAGVSAMAGRRSAGRWLTVAWLACCGLSAAWAEDAATAFREACARKAADGDSLAIDGGDGRLFLRAELRHLGAGPFWGEAAAKVSRASTPDKADPLPAIVDFAGQLQRLGIGLLVVPVPCKAAIYPEAIGGPAAGRLDAADRDFYALLREKGVDVLDLTDAFLAKPGAPTVYCKTDSHWSPAGCEYAAKLIRERIGKPAWLEGDPDGFTTTMEQREIVGDLTGGQGKETVPARVVASADGRPLEDPKSPVVLMGDSHCLVFHAGGDLHGTGAGLADQLAKELGRPVDVIGARGSGATPVRKTLARTARADPAYLPDKKLVIWSFTAREFTESDGWALVKLVK
jgi:alginate O-acetyltransferase complex protein AlgJ